MNTRSGKEKFRNFQILLDRGSSSTIVMDKQTSKHNQNKSTTTKWETQDGKFMTSKKLNVDFCLSEFSVKNIVTWKCHVDESDEGRYDMTLGRDLIITLGVDLKFSENVIIGGDGPYKG